MKKIILALIISLIVNLIAVIPLEAQTPVVNLIPNPSAEVISPVTNFPQYWQRGNWGENQASFSTSNISKDGKISLKVTLSAYKNGDAKWYFDSIPVDPNTMYEFEDYSKSSVQTEVVIQYIDRQNHYSYFSLGSVTPSSIWQNNDFIFTTPANTASLTIFHLIKSVGYLETDNFKLQKVDPTLTGYVPNNSFERYSNQGATGWQMGRWGNNAALFSYLNTGHTGLHSVKVQMTRYTDGDAKWYYDPQTITPGDYLFTDYYQSNTTTQAVVMVVKNDNSISYIRLKNALPSKTWNKYSDSFSLPSDVKAISIFHLITSVGYLITDDYFVSPYQIKGFNRPLVTITFDDGWEDNTATTLPIMEQYGFKATYFFCTQFIQTNSDKQTVKTIFNKGHEIGSHSVTHPHLPIISSTLLKKELSNSKTYLEGIVGAGKVTGFATPYGEYNDTVLTGIKRYYRYHRSVDVGYNTKDNFDIANIRVQNMTNSTSLQEFNSWIAKAKKDKTWLVIVYHRVGTNPDTYDSTPQDFANQMNAVYSSNMTVKTINSAISEITPQL